MGRNLLIFMTVTLVTFIHFVDGTTKMMDMTHQFGKDTIYWPTNKNFTLEIIERGNTNRYNKYENDFWYETNDYGASEHGGTHVDAPSHFYEGAWRMHEIPLENFIGPAVVIDITKKAEADRDAQMMASDLDDYVAKHGYIPAGSILVMNSGWDQYWNDRVAYLGSDDGTTDNLHFPGIHKDAATWIVNNGNITGVGVDVPSLDGGPARRFDTHVILHGANIYGMENVKNAGKIPVKGATLYVMGIPIHDGSGAPARIVAIWDTDPVCDSASYSYRFGNIAAIFLVLSVIFGNY